jgi:excisionase family DNA binding protein
MSELEPVRPEYMTVLEAAEMLRTPVSTLYQWRHKRMGPPASRVGRRLLYKRDDLVAWVESQVAS